MGRSVHEHHVTLTKEQQDELALGAVADASGVPLDDLRANLARLERLCPPLARRRARGEIKPAELARLALDLNAVAAAILRVKRILPDADAAEICAARPALFRPEGCDRARNAADAFRDAFDPDASRRADADAILAAVPEILIFATDEEVRDAARRAETIRELLPAANVAKLCGARPEFLTTPDAGASLARGGHAAGLEVGRSYEPGVPKRRRDGDGDGDGDGFVPGKWRADGWHVADSAREMRRRMAVDCDVDRLLTDFPNILAMDVPALFEDLRRVFPDKEPGDVLRRDPRIATRVRDEPGRRSRFFSSPTLFLDRGVVVVDRRPRPLVRVLAPFGGCSIFDSRDQSKIYRRGLIPSLAADVAV